MRIFLFSICFSLVSASAFAGAATEADMVMEKLQKVLAGKPYSIVKTCDTRNVCTISLSRAD